MLELGSRHCPKVVPHDWFGRVVASVETLEHLTAVVTVRRACGGNCSMLPRPTPRCALPCRRWRLCLRPRCTPRGSLTRSVKACSAGSRTHKRPSWSTPPHCTHAPFLACRVPVASFPGCYAGTPQARWRHAAHAHAVPQHLLLHLPQPSLREPLQAVQRQPSVP